MRRFRPRPWPRLWPRLWPLVLALLLALPVWAQAQGTATLVADSLDVTGDQRLIADGNVEVFYDGTRLSAARITYDQATDRLDIVGPILIAAPDGTILTADRASLDPRLENGLLRGARLVLARHLQLAANRIDRVDGRYSALTRTAVTSCQVCGDRAPLWEIRADRIVHDAIERQLYFDNATLRVAGVPVLWLPRMRLPDPTLDRATGFLIPGLRSTDQLGLGLRLPYFIRIGDRRDLTLTPYVSPETRTLEARFRQAFLRGDLVVEAAASRDSVRPDETRGYALARGRFDLGRDVILDFTLQDVTDPAYLVDYGHSDADRLASTVALTRVRPRDLLRADLTWYRSLRADEDNAALPPLVGRLSYDTRLIPARFGGTLDLGADLLVFERTGAATGDAGRDVARIGAGIGWRRDWLLPGGLQLEARARHDLAYYRIADDPALADTAWRSTPAADVTLRWPWMRVGPTGAVSVIEPVVALGWSRTTGDPVPNEDSPLSEFDESALLALSRFPGADRRESGPRAAIGLDWTRTDPAGWAAGLSFGRVFRQTADADFTASSGLDGTASDWLIAGSLDLAGGLRLDARSLLNADLSFNKTAARVAWANPRIDLAAAYVWLPADPGEGRLDPTSEWEIDTTYRIDDRWSLGIDGRYDFADERPVRAGIEIGWRNECVTVDLSVDRRYAASAEVEPTTALGLAVNLTGFSVGRSGGAAPAGCTP